MRKLGSSLSSLTSWKKNKTKRVEPTSEVFAYVLPPLVRNTLEYLSARSAASMEGIFRVPGAIAEIEKIAKKYEKGKEPPLDAITNPHTVAGLLKHYIRNKPGALVPIWSRSCFLAAGDIEDESLRILCVTKALKLLPASNLYILTKICEYLHEVQKYEKENKMSAHNLSLIFGNTFMPASSDNMEQAFVQSSHAYAFTETMIRHYKRIFESEQQDVQDLGDDIPVKAKAFLDLFVSSSSPILTHKQRGPNADLHKSVPSSAARKEQSPLLSLPHSASVGFNSTLPSARKNSLPVNKYLEEAVLKSMCVREDVDLLADYLRLGETELFANYLARISPDANTKDKVRKAAIKMYRDKSKQKES